MSKVSTVSVSLRIFGRDLTIECLPKEKENLIKAADLLNKELDADDGELTRTRKVRRNFIAEKYKNTIDALYGIESHCQISTELVFEDGRKGLITADVMIRNAQLFDFDKKIAAE